MCGQVAAADEIIGEPKELLLQHQQVATENAEKISVSLKGQHAILMLTEKNVHFKKVTAEIWTKEDRSDLKKLEFERDTKGQLQAPLQGEVTSARIHVSVKAEAEDGSIYEIKDYQFDWLITPSQTTTSTSITSTTTFSNTTPGVTTRDTTYLTSTFSLPASTTRVTEPQKITESFGVAKGTLSVKNHNSKTGTFDVIVSNVSLSTGLKTVKLPIWTEEKGQDDLKWYTATRQSDGTYKVTVQKKSHKNGTGLYHIHLYYENKAGKIQGVASTTTSLATTGHLSVAKLNQSAGTFDIIVRSVASPSAIETVKIPVWTEENGQDDLKWYTAKRQSDGSYKVSVSKKNHKNGAGVYHIHLYYTFANGKMEGVSSTKTTLSAPSTGKMSFANVNYQKGSFDVIISQVTSSTPIQEVRVPVWTEENGQDDLKWYTAKRQSNGTYKVTIQKSQHKNGVGTYHVHLYYTYPNGQMEGITSTKATLSDIVIKGKISVTNHNANQGSFDVIVSNINSPTGIEKIQVPVWSDRNGQDDIVWYTAKKQTNGTYKVTVKASNHKHDTGTYHVHVYLDSKGKRHGLGTTTTSMKYTVPKAKSGKNFVDVSSHNGSLSVSDYRTLLSKGVTGVVVKLTEGTSYTNPYAASQVKNAQTAGLKVSVYHYSHFTSANGAQAEARYFVAAAKKLNLSTSTVMVNDIEEDKSRANINANMEAWEKEMQRLGYGNLVHYAGASWLDTNRLGYSGPIKTSQFGLHNFWVAHYPYLMGMTAEQAYQMNYYSTSAAWQFTSKARLLTGRSYFDLNIDYTGRFTN